MSMADDMIDDMLNSYMYNGYNPHQRIYVSFLDMLSTLTTTWKTKEGKEINIKDMDTNHLKNTLKFIEKECKKNEKNPYDYTVYLNMKEEYIFR